MRLVSPLSLTASLLGLAAAEDFVFHEGFLGPEFQQVRLAAMGFTAVAKTDEEWRAMTVDDFKAFKAIAIGDQQCRDPEDLAWFRETKSVWGPAVLGNIAVMGTQHIFTQSDGWTALMDDALRFVANGTGTGLYYATSCSPDDDATHTLDDLDVFGPITYIANPRSTNPSHVVVQGAPWTDLSDDVIGNMESNAGTLFITFPTDFEAAVITTSNAGRAFADQSNGLPFVITRGAVPVGCGDGKWEPLFGEQCDPSADPEGVCKFNCRCASASVCPKPPGGGEDPVTTVDPGTTLTISADTTTASDYVSTGTDDAGETTAVYTTSSVYDPTSLSVYPTDTFTTSALHPTYDPVYSTTYPSYPTDDPVYPTYKDDPAQPTYPVDVCGVEIIYVVDIVEYVRPGETVTLTTTNCISTLQRPIYRTTTPGYPCFACMWEPRESEYMTVITTSCPSRTDLYQTVTVQQCHSCAYKTVTTELPGYTPGVCVGCSTYVAEKAVVPVTTVGIAPSSTKVYLPVTAAAALAQKPLAAAGALGGLAALAVIAL